jgi:hypothetical protein
MAIIKTSSGQLNVPPCSPRTVAVVFVCLAIGIVLLLYYPTLHCGFRGEEFQVLWLVKNNFSFYNSFIAQFMGTFHATNFFYRPVPREFSYFIVTSLFGFTPLAFRIILLNLFLINIFLVYTLTKTFTQRNDIAFLSAAFFASRFCHVELMYWILFGFENLILGFFIFTTVLVYIYFLRTSQKRYLGICCILTLLALLTKESAIVLPLYIVLTHVLLTKSSFRQLLYCVLPFAGISLIFVVRIFLIRGNMSGGAYGLVFSPYALGKNALWYVYHCFNGPLELGLCAITVCISFILCRNDKAALFGLGWFFVSLIPFVAFKRTFGAYLFIPVFGISIVVAQSIQSLLDKRPFKKALCMALICCVFVLGDFKNIRSDDQLWQETDQYITSVLKSLEKEFPSFPDNSLIYIKGKEPNWKWYLLGRGRAFMLKYNNISVHFEFWKKEPSGHFSDIYYFTLSDDSMKFIGRESQLHAMQGAE